MYVYGCRQDMMRLYFLYPLYLHRRYERCVRGVLAQWERYGDVMYRDEVVKSNVVKSDPPFVKRAQ